MLYLAIFFTLLLSAKTQNLSDVNYSFDIDFYRDFDSKKCDGRNAWQLVRYNTLNIESPYVNSDKGIQASRKSCTSSFPINFFGGILEINVYTRASSQKFGISVEVFNEEETSIYRYVYGRSSTEFGLGWRTIALQINNFAKGYIQLRGTSLNNEIVVIDSFRYKPNNTITPNFERAKRSVNYDENETENIYNKNMINENEEKENKKTENDEESAREENSETSGVSSFEGILDYRTESINGSKEEPQQKDESFWIPLVVFLSTLALLGLVTGVSAYHCGKIRATDPPSIFNDDLEPARTISIPRVTASIENVSRFTRFD